MDSGRGSQAGQRGAKPVASASLSGAGHVPGADRVACYDMMAHVSLSLMSFVSAELGQVITETPEAAVRLSEVRRVIREVTDDLEVYRRTLEALGDGDA